MNFKSNLFTEEISRICLNSESVSSKYLCSSKNILITERGIESRPGMKLSEEPIVFDPWEFSDGYTQFTLTDMYFNINGEAACIAVCTEDDNYSNINYHIRALFSDGSHQDMGYISFTRTDSYTFGVPASYVIYSGKPVTGCGIFFLTRIVYGNNPDTYRIYELSEDMTVWHSVSDSDLYIPTVFINGHGDSAISAISDDALSLSAPRKLESANMLSGRSHSYYTTDGYSYSFSLPFIPAEQTHIGCRLDINSDSFIEWNIAAGESVSDTVPINGTSVRIRCQHSLGRIFFETESGALYTPAFFGKENNLRFTAEKSAASSALKVCSMSCMCTATAAVSEGTGSVTLFSGSDLYPDELIWIDPEFPLYFPENCSLSISDSGTSDVRTVALDGRFLIFKKQKIFSAKLSSADRYDLDGIIHGISNSGKTAYPSVSIDRQTDLPAPFFANTVKQSGNSVFFYCKNGNVYKTDSSLSLTACTESFFCEPCFSALLDNKYIIFSGKDGYVYDPKTGEKLGLYHWDFPVNFSATLTLSGKTVFFSEDDDGTIYSFTLSGDDDSYITSDQTPLKIQPIVSTVMLRLISCDRRCRLYSISASTDTEKPFELHLICDGKESETVWLSERRSLIHKPLIFRDLSAKFCFSGAATLYDIGLKYSKLSKL